MFSIFGSCRIHNVSNNNYLNMDLTFTHNTKEAIQFIHFLKGKKEMPQPYDRLCFRTPIDLGWKHGVILTDQYKERFSSSNVLIMEICSRKKYIHNGYYLHHLAVDRRFNPTDSTPEYIKNEYIIEKQSDKEIEDDIEEIQHLIYPKQLVIVSHYDAKLNGEFIPDRHNLVTLLDNICNRKNIPFINPTVVLKHLTQEQALQPDLGHYNEIAQNTMKEYIYDFCMNINNR